MLLSAAGLAAAQTGGGHTIFGDLKVDDSKVEGLKPISFTLVLYSVRGGSMIARQNVPKGGRYRFENVPNGNYEIVVQMENTEVARVRVTTSGSVSTDFRKDISLEWRSSPGGGRGGPGGVVPAADSYARTAANQRLFDKAEEALKKKQHQQALSLFRQIAASDPKDFEAWTEVGTVNFILGHNDEAESAYLRALAERPAFSLALLNFGKLRMVQKNFAGAIEVLTQAVHAQPTSADANHFLGEAYLNKALKEISEGSQDIARLDDAARQSVHYFNEALQYDPAGKAEIHLRLADIYNVLGMKAEAVAECEKFLAKRPNYPEKEQLLRYIAENKKR